MSDRMAFLWPEIALFVATCVVMIVGLSKGLAARKAAAVVAGLGLLVALFLSMATTPHTSPASCPISGVEFAPALGAGGVDLKAGQLLLPDMVPFAKCLICIVGFLMLLVQAGTVDRMEERLIAEGKRAFDPLRTNRAEYYAFFLFSLTGLLLVASADDLIWLFLALELTSLPTYIMVAISTARNRGREGGVKYFFLGALGAAIFLYGFALIYGGTGSTNLNAIALSIQSGGINSVTMAGMLLALLGIGFKIAAVPMHFYTADVYQGAASQVSAFLAFVPKTAGFLAIILLCATMGWNYTSQRPTGVQEILSGGLVTIDATGSSLPEAIRLLLWVMAALTMTVGNVLALQQTSVKRMLAYSSIAHSGYMLVGIIAGPGDGTFATSGISAVLFYLLSYGVMNLGVFAVLAAVERKPGHDGEYREIDHIDDIKGLWQTHPVMGVCMTVCSLSLLGLPPLLGFWGKLPLFSSGIHAGEYALVVVLGLNSAIAAFYYLRLAFAPYLESRDAATEGTQLSPFATRQWGAIASAGGVVVLSFVLGQLATQTQRAGVVNSATRMQGPMLPKAEATQVVPVPEREPS
jgi:NADH-quinone oxidoreductase subunit N